MGESEEAGSRAPASWRRRLGLAALVVLLALPALRIFGRWRASEPPCRTVTQPVDRAPERPPGSRPNVVIITVDTLRADRLGIYGYDRDTSPAIDALATESIVFERAYSSSPWTLPALATMMTGMLPPRHGLMMESGLSEDVLTLAEMLAEHGYRSAAFTASPYEFGDFGLAQGFGLTVSEPTDMEHILGWLRRNEQGPFLLWTHLIDPHAPYYPAPPYRNLFTDVPIPESDGLRAFANDDCGLEEATERERIRALYDGSIREADAHIERLLGELRSRGLWDRTVVLLTADHGEEFGERGSCGHGHTLYEELLRIPMLLRIPGVRSRCVETPVGLMDVLPTLVDALGFEKLAHVDGQSLVRPKFGSARLPWPGFVSLEGDSMMALTKRDEKIFCDHGPGRPGCRAFDLREDPGETVDRFDPDLHGPDLAWLEARIHEARRCGFTPVTVDIDDEQRERLQALGYVGGS